MDDIPRLGGERFVTATAQANLTGFTQRRALAIADADARAEAARLAREQAALRSVAMVVAREASQAEVFDAIATEIRQLIHAEEVRMVRYDDDGTGVVVASSGDDDLVPIGSRVALAADSTFAEHMRSMGIRSVVGAPILVDGRLWGAMTAGSRKDERLAPDTESRLAGFTELVAGAIANADARGRLAASRACLVRAGNEARRRVARDLHDGVQQRLVHAIVTLKLAQQAMRENDGEAASLVAEALEMVQQGNVELRELARGNLPSVLTGGGLAAAIESLVARHDLPVELSVGPERFSPEIEASAYFMVAEALTNVVKHSHAERAEVRARIHDDMLHVEVRDDGIGGADSRGHGLVGIGDRMTALGGRLEIESPPNGGTVVTAALPYANRLVSVGP